MYKYIFLIFTFAITFSNCTGRKTADIFTDKAVHVNLVHMDAGMDYHPEKENSELQIFIGKPKEQFAPLYGNNSRIWINEKFYTANELPLQCELYFLSTEKEKRKIIVFADRETPMNFIKDILVQFFKNGISRIHIAISSKEDSKNDLAQVLMVIDGNVIEVADLDKTFEDWLISNYES